MKASIIVLSLTGFTFVPAGLVAQEDLFAEAGHSMARSRYVTVRTFPLIEIALEADDVVLIESVNHPPQSLAMRLDGEAVAADCEITETKENRTSYTSGTEKKKDDDEKRTSSTTSEITTTYFHGKCQFPSGTTERALNARDIAVQVALAGGTTNPKHLSAKAISKFQSLDK